RLARAHGCFRFLRTLPVGCYRFVFFFSSRRRHTRSLRDWSSDVCSSDLDALSVTVVVKEPEPPTVSVPPVTIEPNPGPTIVIVRSEERRVGKECRSRGAAWRYKKKKMSCGTILVFEGEGGVVMWDAGEAM